EILTRSDFGFVHQVLTFTRVRPGSIYQVSSALGTSWPALLHLVRTYGPSCLTDEEQQRVLARHLRGYYRFLGKSLLLSRDRKTWRYHRDKMVAAGVSFSVFRVAVGALSAVCDVALNPKRAVAALLNA